MSADITRRIALSALASLIADKAVAAELHDISELRRMSPGIIDFQQVRLASSWNTGDGPGTFNIDPHNRETADDGGVVIVDANGRRWRRHITGPLDVRWWGARDDGKATAATTQAFRAAIAFAKASQGRHTHIYLGRGHFKLWPLKAGEDIITIDFGGLSIIGDGPDKCILDCYGRSGVDPESWEVVDGKLWRGSLFMVKGGRHDEPALDGFHLAGIACRGNLSRTSDHNWPANPSTGAGWDITHKCVCMSGDTKTDDISISDCHLTGWRGEIVYAGGENHRMVRLKNVLLAETNGSALSMTGGLEAERVTIQRAYNGVENYPGPYHQNFTDFTICECVAAGMVLGGATDPKLDDCVGVSVTRTAIQMCDKSGIMFTRQISHASIDGVYITDCPIALHFEPQQNSSVHDIKIRDVRVTAVRRDVEIAIGLFVAQGASLKRIDIQNVKTAPTTQNSLVSARVIYSVRYYGPIGNDVTITNCQIKARYPPQHDGAVASTPTIKL